MKLITLMSPYVLNVYTQKLNEAIAEAAATDNELDIAGAKFEPQAAAALRNSAAKYPDLKVIDSQNEVRNRILQEGREIYKGDTVTLQMPEHTDEETVKKYIATLDPEVTYSLDGVRLHKDVYCALLGTALLLRPELKFCVYITDALRHVSDIFTQYLSELGAKQFKFDVNLTNGGGFTTLTVNNDIIYIPAYGEVEFRNILNCLQFCPVEYGTVDMFDTANTLSGDRQRLWCVAAKRAYKECIRVLNKYEKESHVNLHDYVRMKEV